MSNPSQDPAETSELRPRGPTIGHVHLKVANLERSLAFYCGVLGFRVTQRLNERVVLISMGGDYHHHIALNTRESLGGSPPDRSSTGLEHFAILYPTRGQLADAVRQVSEQGITFRRAADYGISESIHVDDPDGIGVELSWDRPAQLWPRTAAGELNAGMRGLDVERLLQSNID
jgi:catechol 2,3-dioxygenase